MTAVLGKVEKRGTAHRLRQQLGGVPPRKAKGATKSNPAADSQIVMKKVPKSKRRSAIVKTEGPQRLLSVIEDAGASQVTKLGSRFLALTAQRPGMVWRLREDDAFEHEVQLAPQAVEILRSVRALTDRLALQSRGLSGPTLRARLAQ